MIQSAFNMNPHLPGTVIGGVPTMGLTGSPLIGGGYDVDPISPGVQAQKGILTATGPSRIVPGTGGIMGAEMMASGFAGAPGFGSAYGGAGFRTSNLGMYDADPITPGIQAQPGIVTPVGPPRIVGGPGFVGGGMTSGLMTSGLMNSGVMTSGYRGVGVEGVNTTFGGAVLGGGLVDADPITPGIQAQPGVVTPVGPPVVFGNAGAVGGALSNALGGTLLGSGLRRSGVIGYDADPITPGIQSQPGVVTPLGPTQVVGSTVGYGSGVYGTPGYIGRSWLSCCPWWLWIVLGLLLLGALIGGLFALNQQSSKDRESRHRISKRTITTEETGDEQTRVKEVKEDNSEEPAVKTVDKQTEETNTTTPAVDQKDLESTTKKNTTTTTTETTTSNTTVPAVDTTTTPPPTETTTNTSTTSTTATQSSTSPNQPATQPQDAANTTTTTSNTQTQTTSTTPVSPKQDTTTPAVPTPTETPSQTAATPTPTSVTATPSPAVQPTPSSSSQQNNSAQAQVSRKRLNRKKKLRYLKRTVTKTTFQNQIVDPILSEPKYVHRHLHRASL